MVAWQIAKRAAWLGIACLEARSVVGGRFAGLCAWLLTSFRRQLKSCDWLWRVILYILSTTSVVKSCGEDATSAAMFVSFLVSSTTVLLPEKLVTP